MSGIVAISSFFTTQSGVRCPLATVIHGANTINNSITIFQEKTVIAGHEQVVVLITGIICRDNNGATLSRNGITKIFGSSTVDNHKRGTRGKRLASQQWLNISVEQLVVKLAARALVSSNVIGKGKGIRACISDLNRANIGIGTLSHFGDQQVLNASEGAHADGAGNGQR